MNIEPALDLTRREKKDLQILALFTAVYCRDHQHQATMRLTDLPEQLRKLSGYRYCSDCLEFLEYAVERRMRCPLEDKPSCKHCSVHCYRPGHREKVREIMRFSGQRLILRGRLDLLWHYLF
ncbi:MAG: nitrous oxide-stimulated promoter family protein [Desulfuromonadales bacterium]|nr:nitrous oxide-stimulated promoter family protein [Desulfuromonadales bacterium]MBN2791739.1 nitrous oxide-stimulated promoter family protein [Desulfuromonadales bacterium]